MRQPSASPPFPISCLQIEGGNADLERHLSLPGIEAWIAAQAHAGAQAGGDIHYFSTCGHGHVVRFAVLDVAGHGAGTAPAARRLRQLMRRHLDELDQTAFLQQLNHDYLAEASAGRFATALLASFHRPTQHLVVCNAGHPRPLWYRSAVRAWQFVDHALDAQVPALLNLPLGIVEPTDYRQFAFPLSPGDLVVIYSDGYPETRVAGVPLGDTGLLALAREVGHRAPAAFGPAFVAALAARTGTAPAADDRTLLVFQPTFEEPPPLGVRERLVLLGKMVGLVPV